VILSFVFQTLVFLMTPWVRVAFLHFSAQESRVEELTLLMSLLRFLIFFNPMEMVLMPMITN